MRSAWWVVVVTVVASTCGSSSRPLTSDGGGAGTGAGGSGGTAGPSQERFGPDNRDVDILFMVDNSLSMLPLQMKLIADFPTFVQTLQSLPGGLPNIHLAVVSSDMGAGNEPTGAIQRCALGGDQGIFQSSPRGTCTTSGLNSGQRFISNLAGAANYTGTLESVFSCIALLGDQGCGFEHQLASVARAVGADTGSFGQPPAENDGFLRPQARLAIVLFTNEDDCSAPPNSGLFDTGSRFISDPLGPLLSYRCNDFGHLCNGKRPPRDMAVDLSGTCHSAEGQGMLIPVASIVDQLKGLKRDPAGVFVAALSGAPDPYIVTLIPSQSGDPSPSWPVIGHSCAQSATEFADPGVRIAELVKAFGANGLLLSICAPSFAPALQLIAQAIGATPHCLARPAVQANCTATVDGTPLPACGTQGGALTCFAVRANLVCPSGSDVVFQNTAPSATFTVTCNGG